MVLPDPLSTSPAPLPTTDFADRDLPIETVAAGVQLIRLHHSDLGPVFFGTTGGNRFDDPRKEFGICYLATSIEGAFAETCLRAVGARFVALSYLEARSFCEIEVLSPLRLVSLHGPGLARLGATGVVSSGPHDIAQQWSRAIHDHPSLPNGIAYRSNHDNGEFCVALFERAAAHIEPGTPEAILMNRDRLARLLDRYKVGLG